MPDVRSLTQLSQKLDTGAIDDQSWRISDGCHRISSHFGLVSTSCNNRALSTMTTTAFDNG